MKCKASPPSPPVGSPLPLAPGHTDPPHSQNASSQGSERVRSLGRGERALSSAPLPAPTWPCQLPAPPTAPLLGPPWLTGQDREPTAMISW